MIAAITLLKQREESLRRRLVATRSAGSRCIGDDALKMVQRVIFDHLEDEIRFTQSMIAALESIPKESNEGEVSRS